MLHALTLGINHPESGKYLEFKTDPPLEFRKLLEVLRNREK